MRRAYGDVIGRDTANLASGFNVLKGNSLKLHERAAIVALEKEGVIDTTQALDLGFMVAPVLA